MERLHKYLARSGVASRRASELLITGGRVAVNGKVVLEPGTRVDPSVDQVELDGRPLPPLPAKVYVIVNKPLGTLTTMHDPRGRPTVADLVPGPARLFPAGRLDADSEGLLLMTNDGDLAHRLMHPRFGCEKAYRVLVRGVPAPDALRQLSRGVRLDDGLTAPAVVELAERAPAGRQWLRVVLREGRKRQIRRMLASMGVPVERLVRVRLGPILLGDLAAGGSRVLGEREIAALREGSTEVL